MHRFLKKTFSSHAMTFQGWPILQCLLCLALGPCRTSRIRRASAARVVSTFQNDAELQETSDLQRNNHVYEDQAVFLELVVISCETHCDNACSVSKESQTEYVHRACMAINSNATACGQCASGIEQDCCECLARHREEILVRCGQRRPDAFASHDLLVGNLTLMVRTPIVPKGRLVVRHAYAEHKFWSSKCLTLGRPGSLDLGENNDIQAKLDFIDDSVMEVSVDVTQSTELRGQLLQHHTRASPELTEMAKAILLGMNVMKEGIAVDKGKEAEFWEIIMNMSDIEAEVWYSQERKIELVCSRLLLISAGLRSAQFRKLLIYTQKLAGANWIQNIASEYAQFQHDLINGDAVDQRCPCYSEGVYRNDPCEWIRSLFKKRSKAYNHVTRRLAGIIDRFRNESIAHERNLFEARTNISDTDTPHKILVVGGGPLGLFSAFSAAIAYKASGMAAHIRVVEMRVDFYRGNGLTLWPATAKLLQYLGWKDLMPKSSLEFVRDAHGPAGTRATQISSVQRFFWRLGLLLGVRVDFLVQFVGVCPVSASKWEALLTPTPCSSDLDEKSSCWLRTPRTDTDKDSLCSNPPAGTQRHEFDLLIGADGTRSSVRAIADGIKWQEDADVRFHGMTLTYRLAKGQSCSVADTFRRAKQALIRGKIVMATPYKLAPYCYTSVVFGRREGVRISRYSLMARLWWIRRYFKVKKGHLNIKPNGLPDVALLNVKFAYADNVGSFLPDKPPIFLAGDSYAPGFYFLGNGFNGGIARLQSLWRVGHFPALIQAINDDKAKGWLNDYTQKLGTWDAGEWRGPSTSKSQFDWNVRITDRLISKGLTSPAYLWTQFDYLKAKKAVCKSIGEFWTAAYTDLPVVNKTGKP